MGRTAKKRAAHDRQAAKWRLQQCMDLERCEFCGKRRPFNNLCVHEILKGPLRKLAMDKPFATLVVCKLVCHYAVDRESKARQLARLYHSRPGDYDLAAFWMVRARRLPEQTEIDLEIQKLVAIT